VCAVGGDAAELVKRVNKCDFPTAIRFLAELAGVILPEGGIAARKPPALKVNRAPIRPPDKSTGLTLEDSIALVNDASQTLWGPCGKSALDYLRGRGLTDETVRGAGLGFTPGVMIPTQDGDRSFRFSGITIPWRDGARLTRVKIRRICGGAPKYLQAYSDRPLIYPDPAAIRPGKPLIICEGEFDCLLLGQHLPEASVITLGSASARTDPAVLSRMLTAPRWYLAHDADAAGDSAAARFPASAIRVRPPTPDKDWGEVHAGGFNMIRYVWGRHLALGVPIVFAEPDDEPDDEVDPYRALEREAIQAEPPTPDDELAEFLRSTGLAVSVG
jgi:DNA primase